MTRSDFTVFAARLIIQMHEDGLRPAGDYLKRSDEEQHRLFLSNSPGHWVTDKDGYKSRSDHQDGKAIDILLFNDQGRLITQWLPEIAKKYHDLWVSWGGKPVIGKDIGHFGVA